MFRYLSVLILFWGSLSWAQMVPNLEVYTGEVITLEEPVLAAYSLDNLKIVGVEVRSGYPVIIANRTGDSIVQLLKTDGSMDSLLIRVNRRERPQYERRQDAQEGYSVRAKIYYGDSYVNRERIPGNPNYGANLSVYTKVKNNSSFFGTYNYNNERIDSFFAKAKYFKVYAAYGDESLLSNELVPSFLNRPLLRQTILGYDGDRVKLDIWQGQPSKGGMARNQSFDIFNNRGVSDSYNPYSVNYDSSFYGARGSVFFGEKKEFALFGSSWNYDLYEQPINYLGAHWNLFNQALVLRGSVGGTEDRPTYAYMIRGVNTTSSLRWFKGFTLFHEMAPKGFDSLYYFSVLPMERIHLEMELGGTNNIQDGLWYLMPNVNYSLDGFYKTENYGATIGWKNKLFNGYVTHTRTYSENTVDTTISSNVSQVRPGFALWLTEEANPVRYRLDAYQNFNLYDSLGMAGSSQESSLRLARVWNGTNTEAGMRIARTVYTRDTTPTREGMVLNPYFNHRKDKLFFNAGVIMALSDSFTDDGGSQLTSSRAYVNSGYDLSNNWSISARYNRSSIQYLANRYSDGDNFRIEVTYRDQNSEKSLFSVFDANPIRGRLFEDLNFNEKYEPGEPVRANVQISLWENNEKKMTVTTNDKGEFDFKRVPYGSYTVQVDAGDLTVKNLPSVIQVKQGTELDLQLALGKYIIKNVSFKYSEKDKLPEQITLRQSCEKSGLKIIGVSKTGGKISIPEKDFCSLSVDLSAMSENNLTISSNNLPLVGEGVCFSIAQSKFALKGQIYVDKNSNNIWDDGEELIGKFPLAGITIETDENGFFSVPLEKFKEKNYKIKSFKFKKYLCQPSLSELNIQKQNLNLSIRCK